jgi:hypothetical protein
MPESPAIVAKVKKALAGRAKSTTLRIPWSDFVFSTRNGRVFMPPTLAKAIKIVSKGPQELAGADGVTLRVERGRVGSGSFRPGDHTLTAPPLDDSTIRHETLHFVQRVGDALVRTARGDKNVFSFAGWSARRDSKTSGDEAVEAMRRGGVAAVLALADRQELQALRERTHVLYGGPKRRSAHGQRGITDTLAPIREARYHALLDVEFHTDVLSLADHVKGQAALLGRKVTGSELDALVEKWGKQFTMLMRPVRKKDFLRLAKMKAREVAADLLVAERPARPTRAPVPERVQPPKRAPATPRRGAALPQGLRISHEMYEGRMAYVIYRGAEKTGKYAFSESKAQQIMERLKG